VLPFVNMSKDPDQEYFSDGLTEDLITDLSKFSGLFVIARNSVFTYKGKAVKVEEVGWELGVRYILEGSTRKAGERLRFTAQLVEAATGRHVWAERYDRPLTDIFTVQDEIVQQIGAAMRVEVQEAEQVRVRRIPTENLNAYDAVLRGLEYAVRFTPEGIAQARQWYERAVALDSQYAEAYARLGWTYWMEWLWWNQDPLLLERAGELARQAIALNDSLPYAHLIMGMVYLWRDQQYEQAIAEGKHAITLDPNWADAYVGLTDILNFAGRAEEAVELVQKAMRLNPYYPAVYPHVLGVAYNLTGQYEEAIMASKEALRRNPNFLAAYTFLAGSYLVQWAWQWSQDPQTLERAVEAAQQAVALSDSTYWAHGTLSVAYLWQKHHEAALAEAERALALNSQDALSQTYWANVLNLAGRAEESLARMEQVTCSTAFGTGPPFCFLVLGDAYSLTGRHEEAIAAYKQVLSNKPGVADRLAAHLNLAALYSELGQEAEARKEAAEVLRLNPQFSLEVHKERVPIKDPAVLDRHIAALRKAGLK
jgi:TolB-like protein/Tfp pilus assembly protein PilF